MSLSLDDIWSEPLFAKSPSPRPEADDADDAEASPRPKKRPRSSLFLDGSDDEQSTSAPPKAPSQADIDALFADDYEDPADIAPAFDVEAYRKEAEKRAAAQLGTPSLTPYAVQSSSPPRDGGNEGKSKKRGTGELAERKTLPKLDETRLLGTSGLPALVQQCKGFRPKGKGNEANDLNRLFSMYQFWGHRMYPKIQFSDTVERVEKLCRSRRMQVALGVWRDQAKGTINGVRVSEKGGEERRSDGEDDNARESHSPSRPQSVDLVPRPSTPAPPTDDDDVFDIDSLLAQEEDMMGATPSCHASANTSTSSIALSGMGLSADEDEEAMWLELNGADPVLEAPAPPLPAPALSQRTGSHHGDEMWDILDEMERPSLKAPTDASGSRPTMQELRTPVQVEQPDPTEQDEWDDMYI